MARPARHPIFARLYARLSGAAEAKGTAEHRDEMLAGIAGRVVEVGAGNGLNFAHYPPAVTEVVAVEPESYVRPHRHVNVYKPEAFVSLRGSLLAGASLVALAALLAPTTLAVAALELMVATGIYLLYLLATGELSRSQIDALKALVGRGR